jgi:hypothetical protein
MPIVDIDYEQLPSAIKDNLSPDQWRRAQRGIIAEGTPVPDTTRYIDVKSGLCFEYQAGEPARGYILPVHDLSGAGGKENAQFETAPRGAHGPDARGRS